MQAPRRLAGLLLQFGGVTLRHTHRLLVVACMFDVFAQYIRQQAALTAAEIEVLRARSVVRKLRKWQSLLHEGEVWRLNCFIASGCCRLYRFSEDGTDHTLRFAVENWWMMDQESYRTETPSVYNMEALAATTVITWTKPAWEELMHEIPALKTFSDQLLSRSFEAGQRRIFSLISSPAEAKYLEFQKTYPLVFNRVPLHMVASYLGMSRETLSRLRR
jgi:CRP-like cAMP-binding protein